MDQEIDWERFAKRGIAPLKVLHLNRSNAVGGAAKAAVRIHHALLTAGVDSFMHVSRGIPDATTEVDVSKGGMAKTISRLRLCVANSFKGLLKTENPILHSPSMLPSSWPKRISQANADIVHLHWVCNEMISVEDIGRIKKPIVWTLHDMWAFCGAEHYTDDKRFHEGYRQDNRPDYESGYDINRWTWNRKLRAWRRPMYIVAPSRWLADCVKQSALMRDWPVQVIPNPINTELWKMIEKRTARTLLGIRDDCQLVGFGAMEGTKDTRKGVDLFMAALNHLRGEMPDLEVMVFGESRPPHSKEFGFPVHYVGHLHDDLSLRVLYSAADVVAIPSRQENLPNIGIEAMACGTPVIAFETGGMPDIVLHQQTGWLAKAFDSEDYACGIQWLLSEEERLSLLGENAREKAERCFSVPVVVSQYKALYHEILQRF